MKHVFMLLVLCGFPIAAIAQWTAFGTAAPSYVIGFETYDDTLYCYGYPSPNIYKWNATDWQQVPQIPAGSGGTHSLRVIDSTLYAACYATGNTNYVYYWQNNSWQQLGGMFQNIGSQFDPTLYDFAEYNNELYVCGEFNRIGADTIIGIARWDGSNWVAVGSGLAGGLPPYTSLMYPHQLLVHNNELLVCGNFRYAGTDTVNGIARWNGSTWSRFGVGFNKVAYGMGTYNGELFAGGEFTTSASTSLSCIAKWDGTAWQNPGFGVSYVPPPNLNKFVHTIRQIGPDLYFAGGFNRVTDATGVHHANNVLRFTGTAIDTLQGGTNFDAEGIYPVQGGVLFGGGFSLAGTTTVNQTAVFSPLSGIVEATVLPQFTVSPTAFSTEVSVTNYNGQEAHYELISVDGRSVAAGVLAAKLHFPELPEGLFILRITTAINRIETHRLVHIR